ncbi:MAG: hypothetical protein RIC57_09135 [Balneola sp.]
MKNRKQAKINKMDTELEILYSGIWNGTEIDKSYAWFRVIEHLRSWNYDPSLIKRATIHMNQCQDRRSDRYMVSSGGRLIEVTEIL